MCAHRQRTVHGPLPFTAGARRAAAGGAADLFDRRANQRHAVRHQQLGWDIGAKALFTASTPLVEARGRTKQARAVNAPVVASTPTRKAVVSGPTTGTAGSGGATMWGPILATSASPTAQPRPRRSSDTGMPARYLEGVVRLQDARAGASVVAEALARQSSAPRQMRSSARVRFPPEGDPTLAAPSTAAGA